MKYTKGFSCSCGSISYGVGDVRTIITSDSVMCPVHRAAPTLYEALKELYQQELNHSNIMEMRFVRARKAMAKAEGK